MAKPSLYQVTSAEVDPLSDLLKAIVEVNWHRVRADMAGWSVDLGIADGGALQVQLVRSSWPEPETDELPI